MHYEQKKKQIELCFACEAPMLNGGKLVDTRDGQSVFVGSECYKRIQEVGGSGWQPLKGGPRLYLIPQPEQEGGEP